MYSLIVSSLVGESGDGVVRIERNRFLEYTNVSISAQLKPLSVEGIESIRSWPCVLMQEGRGDERAFICEISEIVDLESEVAVTTRALRSHPMIRNEALWRARTILDIGEFEFSRNHWAIKSCDLMPALLDAGIATDATFLSHFNPRGLPAPERAVLMHAKATIGEWGHTAIDDLLLEAGVPGLDVPKGTGARRDRANAIFNFVFQNPQAKTAENHLFSAYLVRKADRAAGPGVAGQPVERQEAAPPPVSSRNLANRSPNRVFIVHGQNHAAKDQVIALLARVGLQGIVLHDQPNMGRHLLTKFIDEAELVTFAVILMTDDDIGARKGGTVKPRARQNVILELGYFLAHLGQAKVCALITPGLETPSDFDGIVYITMEADKRWENELIRELRAVGMPLTA